MSWRTAPISAARYEGLKRLAEKEKRSVAAQLDLILEKAGVRTISQETEVANH